MTNPAVRVPSVVGVCTPLKEGTHMSKRFTLRLALLAIATLVLGLVAPTGASAQAQHRVAVRGGTTTLTTAPGLVKKLLGAKIVALVTAPGTQSLSTNAQTIVARYPVTSGAVTAKPLGGKFGHRGGLFVTNVGNGKVAAVDNFIVDVTHKILTAHLVGTSLRATVFSLNFKNAVVVVRKGFISIGRIRVLLDPNAARLLNTTLGTKVFKGGMLFGTAVSRLNR
jgi:hypothetical protein